MDINYELYKVFYYVASTLSFSEASKQLFISQSAVSQSIKALEKKLDQTLFIRSTKKVRLTTEGEILLRHIEPAISLIKRGESQLLDVGARGGQLHIGASDTICRYFLVPYLERFHREFPGAHIKVTNATSIRCVELLETGQVDLIVVNSPNSYLGNVPNVKKIKDFQDVFIANEAFKELKGKKVSFKELLDYPILMLDRKSTTSEYLHNLFLQNQLDLVPEIELSSNDLLIDLARIGLGIAFIPDFCLSQTADSDSLFIVETKESLPERELVIAHNEYPKPHRSFYLIFNMFTNSFSCQSIPERTTGGSYFYLLSYKIPCGICPSWYFFLSYCSIIYFSINNIFLILLTSYPSVLPSRTLLSFLRYFQCYRSGNHSTPSETPPGTAGP